MEKTRQQTKLKKIMKISVVLVVLIAVSGAWIFGSGSSPSNQDPDKVQSEVEIGSENEIKEPVLALIMGVDRRPGDRGRSDTMIVAAADPVKERVGLLSLPRDLWVEIPGRGYTKLNHAYAFGGPELALETVAHLLDLPIEHYVVVDFKGFEAIVDAVGGVEIEVEKRMYYHDPYQDLLIDLRPGLQRLNGEQALHYARFRNDAAGDLGRIERQQKFLRALAEAATSPGNILRIPTIVRTLFDAIDTNISLRESLAYARLARKFSNLSIETATLPGKSLRVAGISYLEPDLPEARKLAYEVLLGQEPPAAVLQKADRDQKNIESSIAAAQARYREQVNAQQKADTGKDGADSSPGQSPAGGDQSDKQPDPNLELDDPGDIVEDDAPVDEGGVGEPGLPPNGDDPGDEPEPGPGEDQADQLPGEEQPVDPASAEEEGPLPPASSGADPVPDVSPQPETNQRGDGIGA